MTHLFVELSPSVHGDSEGESPMVKRRGRDAYYYNAAYAESTHSSESYMGSQCPPLDESMDAAPGVAKAVEEEEESASSMSPSPSPMVDSPPSAHTESESLHGDVYTRLQILQRRLRSTLSRSTDRSTSVLRSEDASVSAWPAAPRPISPDRLDGPRTARGRSNSCYEDGCRAVMPLSRTLRQPSPPSPQHKVLLLHKNTRNSNNNNNNTFCFCCTSCGVSATLSMHDKRQSGIIVFCPFCGVRAH